jgi:hypothetical protein
MNTIIDNNNTINTPDDVIVKKRGRKKNIDKLNPTEQSNETTPIDKVVKKRGRKPKGGKVVDNPSIDTNIEPIMSNIILHLKCSVNDIDKHNRTQIQIVPNSCDYTPLAPPNIITYNSSITNKYCTYTDDGNYTETSNNTQADKSIYKIEDNAYYNHTESNICKSCNEKFDDDTSVVVQEGPSGMTEINNKIKQLKIQLYDSNNYDKKSACFWCTCEYDNQTCYIPKYEMNGEICGYGAFCRPECAVAYLLKDNIDDSVKFDRYQLLNMVYGIMNDHKTNIKPSPDPHYTLDKFYGNLTIQEYRKLMNNEHLLTVIDKPMTRVLPELHDDLDGSMENVVSTKPITTGFKVKRQSEKPVGRSKSSIMKERFGLVE